MTTHKTQLTIESYEKWVDQEFTNRLKLINNQMSPEARGVLDNGREYTIPGEMYVYGMLRDAGIDDVTAARVAVAVPDPLKFHPHKPGENGITPFYERIKKWRKPFMRIITPGNKNVFLQCPIFRIRN